MSDFTFTSPEGKSYTVSGPQGATKEQAFGILQKQLAAQPKTEDKEPVVKPTEKGVIDKAVDYAKYYGSGVAGAAARIDDAAKGDGVHTTLAKQALGAGETALGVAGGIAGDVAGAVTSTVTQNANTGSKIRDAISQFTAPRTETGKAIAGGVGAVTKPLGDLFELLPKFFGRKWAQDRGSRRSSHLGCCRWRGSFSWKAWKICCTRCR